MISFDRLNLHVILVFKLWDLHVLDMLNVGNFFFEFFNFVKETTIFEITWSWPVDGDSIMFALPHFDFWLFLVDEFGQFFILRQQLSVMLENKVNLLLQVSNFLGLVLQHGEFFYQTVIFPFQGANQELKRLVVATCGRTICSCISEWTCTWSVHTFILLMKIIFNWLILF